MRVVMSIIALFLAAVLFVPTITMAKMAVRLEQKVVFVQAQDKDGALRVGNDEIYQINNKEIRSKAATFVGNQARLLFFIMPQKQICVDIAPVADPPFEINSPSISKRANGSL